MEKNINMFEKYFARLFNSKSYLKHRIRRLIDKKKIGSFEFRYSIGCLERMHYAYIVFNAANLAKKLKYNSISKWDSIGHMSLIGSLQDAFNISMEMDDIIDFSSYEFGKKILKKYKIVIK